MSEKELTDDFAETDEDLLRAVVDELDKQDREEARKKKGSGHSLKSLMALKKQSITMDTLKESPPDPLLSFRYGFKLHNTGHWQSGAINPISAIGYLIYLSSGLSLKLTHK